jgi:hypothetical protein
VLGLSVAAIAAPSAGAGAAPVKGKYTVGILAQGDSLARLLAGSNVSCVWKGDHVIVRLRLHNKSVEHVTATIKPKYVIRNGGAHGDGFTSGKDFGFDAGETRNLKVDAGSPKGVPVGSAIAACTPYLYLIKSG